MVKKLDINKELVIVPTYMRKEHKICDLRYVTTIPVWCFNAKHNIPRHLIYYRTTHPYSDIVLRLVDEYGYTVNCGGSSTTSLCVQNKVTTQVKWYNVYKWGCGNFYDTEEEAQKQIHSSDPGFIKTERIVWDD